MRSYEQNPKSQFLRTSFIKIIEDESPKSNTSTRKSIDTDYMRLAEKYKRGTLSKEDESNYDIDTDAIREAFTVIDTAWKEKRKGLSTLPSFAVLLSAQYLRLRAASAFFLRFTLGFS